MRPSALYRSELWRIGLLAARILPRYILERTAVALSAAYWAGNASRRSVAERNLLPPLQNDPVAARKTARALFRNFGVKLADLWRYESGGPLRDCALAESEWGRFQAAQAKGRGVLVITPHIGNWEFGAPLLRQKGVKLLVITLAEPQESLTSMRAGARTRHGVDTLVIGSNPFAFVEVIRQLEAGAAVAMLVDRPPRASAVTVKLFGRQFCASVAAAELARATGCVLLPVLLPREQERYSPRLLGEIQYDRASLGNREARANLTQDILGVFEPHIKQHLDQWYHFVPLWQQDCSE